MKKGKKGMRGPRGEKGDGVEQGPEDPACTHRRVTMQPALMAQQWGPPTKGMGLLHLVEWKCAHAQDEGWSFLAGHMHRRAQHILAQHHKMLAHPPTLMSPHPCTPLHAPTLTPPFSTHSLDALH
eukprot:1158163-Pelagomonas_calceolata.AAC.17